METVKILLFLSSLTQVWIVQAVTPLHGKYSDELLEGNLIIPRKVNHKGEHLSHYLTHHHDHDTYHDHDVTNSSQDLHYHIDINNEIIHLELKPHTYFVSETAVLERHKRDLKTRKKVKSGHHKHHKCHFQGKVKGQADSRVAISTCDGIAGHIRMKNSEYYIEPSKHHKPSSDGHPHVVYHPKAIKDKKDRKRNRNGDVDGNGRKRKIHFNNSNSRNSNCGTKEPRRRRETRIEWQPQGKVIVQGGRNVRRHLRDRERERYNLQQQRLAKNGMKYMQKNDLFVENKKTTAKRKEKRIKRSISRPRHVEAMVVADSSMVAFHNDTIESYLLTIMNMVSSLYKDPSIGNSIEIVIVKIIIIDEDEIHSDLNLTDNAQRNLDIFCSWQHKFNANSESDPNHHDVAILVTRRNICGNDCKTLGLANVGGMCKPRKSCSVNEDNGIMLSHTIAHELGHNFGMFHDTMKIGCHGRVGPITHIMTPTFVADTLKVSWSNCSRRYITHFLDLGHGNCLDDEPTDKKYEYPNITAGQAYSMQKQCSLQFNSNESETVKVCSTLDEICSQLWCEVNGECVTNMRPAAPGTSCGKNKWCQNGKCVLIAEIHPIDGGWGNWSEWSQCTRSCGGGISSQYRDCNNPVPANGGQFCTGERRRYTICNKTPCPENEKSFRAVQCSMYDNTTYQGDLYKWLPYFDKEYPCKLFCTDEDDTVIANWGDVADDGTPCEIGTKNMCIDGVCRKVSCDYVLDSSLDEDRCGVCGGNGEGCEPVTQIFKDNYNTTDGYVEIGTIPANSRHIIIKELGNSPHYLSIGKANDSEFYLNGDRLISLPGEFIIAGAESMYDREGEKETIKIPRPIENSITIYVILRNTMHNDGIYYEYTPPILNSSYNFVHNYSWKLSDWTACSATCGGGVQHRLPLCYQAGKMIVRDEKHCWLNAENTCPQAVTRKCNEFPCWNQTHWWTGQWQPCPVTCKIDGDPEPYKFRFVKCLDHNDLVISDDMCDESTKPPEIKQCGRAIPECFSDVKNDIFD